MCFPLRFRCLINPATFLLQMRKLSQEKRKLFPSGHVAGWWQNWE